MKKLIQGIIDFRKNSLKEYRCKFANLALQQSPDALFVACCDSRVVPNVFASSDPGDLFVLRNIGNLIPPYTLLSEKKYPIDPSVSATIEFALQSLNVKDIIICGHSECGAMQTFMETKAKTAKKSQYLDVWLQYAEPSYTRFQNLSFKDPTITPCNLLSRINVLQQLDNLKTYPIVQKYLKNNAIKLHGWWFDLTKADVYYYEENLEKFVLLDEKEASQILNNI